MAAAYFRYEVKYPVIVEYDVNYWEYDWPFMDEIDIIYLFPEEK